MIDTRATTINNLIQTLIFAGTFSLRFTIFCFQFGEGGEATIEPVLGFAFTLIATATMGGIERSTSGAWRLAEIGVPCYACC
jgi:hypothetical protein